MENMRSGRAYTDAEMIEEIISSDQKTMPDNNYNTNTRLIRLNENNGRAGMTGSYAQPGQSEYTDTTALFPVETYRPIEQPPRQMQPNQPNAAGLSDYLQQNIGRWMRVESYVGNTLERKVGQLIDVGAGYIVLKKLDPLTTQMCDINSIKFVTIIYDNNYNRLMAK